MFKFDKILPNWEFVAEECSNNVYLVSGRRHSGNEVSYKDSDLNYALHKCESYAFDIEKQMNKQWSEFLYKIFILKINNFYTQSQIDNIISSSSWYIEIENHRIKYEAIKNTIRVDIRNKIWCNLSSIAVNVIKYTDIINIINTIEKKKDYLKNSQ